MKTCSSARMIREIINVHGIIIHVLRVIVFNEDARWHNDVATGITEHRPYNDNDVDTGITERQPYNDTDDSAYNDGTATANSNGYAYNDDSQEVNTDGSAYNDDSQTANTDDNAYDDDTPTAKVDKKTATM